MVDYLYANVIAMNELICGDNIEILKTMDDNSIDLTVTSPPYDGLRDYNGYSFDFEGIAQQLYRVTKEGGVIVWVVGDAVDKGSETGTSFRQALYFMEIGLRLHDTMIWNKGNFTDTGSLRVRYGGVFEYMFVLSKGKPKTFNAIKDRKNKHVGTLQHGTVSQIDGSKKRVTTHNIKRFTEYGQRHNLWNITPCKQRKLKHPARFPESISHDHILSWSNVNEVVLDPFVGSGTTCKMAKQLNRNYIGIDISQDYIDIAKERLNDSM
tara:strand:- start:77 stop:874 length:798 start_codon:yes stop_codon:yes gene_type:complete